MRALKQIQLKVFLVGLYIRLLSLFTLHSRFECFVAVSALSALALMRPSLPAGTRSFPPAQSCYWRVPVSLVGPVVRLLSSRWHRVISCAMLIPLNGTSASLRHLKLDITLSLDSGSLNITSRGLGTSLALSQSVTVVLILLCTKFHQNWFMRSGSRRS